MCTHTHTHSNNSSHANVGCNAAHTDRGLGLSPESACVSMSMCTHTLVYVDSAKLMKPQTWSTGVKHHTH